MADGPNAASDQFAHDDIGSPETGTQWRLGQLAPLHVDIPQEHMSNDDQTRELDIRRYGACFDPNYRDTQADDEKFPKSDYDQDSDD